MRDRNALIIEVGINHVTAIRKKIEEVMEGITLNHMIEGTCVKRIGEDVSFLDLLKIQLFNKVFVLMLYICKLYRKLVRFQADSHSIDHGI